MKKKAYIKRAAALLLCFVIAAAFLFFAWFVTSHIHHDCTGNDCPVCMLIHYFSDMLRKLVAFVMMLAALFAALTALHGTMMRRFLEDARLNTPVSLKVQLNN